MALTEFQREVIWKRMRRMFRSSWFYDVCIVNNCIEMTGNKSIYYPGAYGMEGPEIRALHCTHFSDMSREFKKELWFKTLAIIDPELHQWGFWYEVEHRPVPWYTKFLKKLREANFWHKIEAEDPNGKKTTNPAQT